MEVVDPFVPSFRPDDSGFGKIPQEWATPFSPADTVTGTETGAPVDEQVREEPAPAAEPVPAADAAPAAEAVPAWRPAVSTSVSGGGAVAQAKGFAGKLADALGQLQEALDASAAEREDFLRERAEMQERIHSLEAEAARKEEFKSLLHTGMGSTLSDEDLQTLQSMTDALTQDPDRLTLLFNVVQQAPKLATAITVYGQLRRLADQS